MKKFFTFWVLLATVTNLFSQAPITFHDYSVVTINGDTINLSKYYGTKVMVVNTASYCEYTPEFTQLQELYEEYSQYHFTILGFPCNDFNSQDPYSDSAIYAFCTDNYQVSFQMMSKVAIVSADTAPVYKWLQQKSLNGVQSNGVSWNFNKFLVDESGHWVRHFDSPTSPLDTAITNWIKSPSSLPPAHIPTTVHTFGTLKAPLFSPPAEEHKKVFSLPSRPAPAAYIGATGITGVNSPSELIKLNSANPTNSVIDFTLSSVERVSAQLYSADGKLVANLFDGMPDGEKRIVYPVSSLSQGIYFIHVQNASEQKTIKYMVER